MRIAHLSDLHALDLTDAAFWRFFSKRFFGYLNLLRKRKAAHPPELFDAILADVAQQSVDHVVVTGDLTNLSLPSEFVRVRKAFDALPFGPQNVTLIPGNHDVYVWEAFFRHSFERHLLPYVQSDGARDDELPTWPTVRVRGNVVFVGCSTALPSPVPLADGWLGKKQLARLEAILSEHKGRIRIVLLHHPPLPQSLDLLRALRDRSAFAAVVQRQGCELVLHGHEHKDLQGSLPGPPASTDSLGSPRQIPVIGVGSGTYRHSDPKRRARYNIYTIENPGPALHLSIETRVLPQTNFTPNLFRQS
ncbi:MAG TPA: metallophosphoesterase [Pseudomonadota bacterium]|nr:metallophosphoesterase [Pseudomonadota bacterium]